MEPATKGGEMSCRIELKSGMRILFQGDSITDAGREGTEEHFGTGYVYIAAGILRARMPSLAIDNRGIGGNRVKDLEPRWQTDCIDLKPDVVSIMIGINDVFWRHAPEDAISLEDYEAGYRRLLQRTRDEIGAKIVMLEPFLLPVSEELRATRADLDPEIDAVRRLAREFADCYVPLDGLFAAAATRAEPKHWTTDGVHPTAAGHALIAMAWLEAVTGAVAGHSGDG